MQFKLTNMGRIGTADVTLNGITIIAGPNGSGKSTISRALFTWFNYLRQVREEVRLERARSVGGEIEKILIDNGIMSTRVRPLYYGRFFISHLADRSFWMDEEKSRDYWRNHCSPNYPHLSSSKEYIHHADQLYETLRQRALYWLDKDEMEVAKFVATRCFAKAFDEQVGTYFDQHAATDVELKSDDGSGQNCLFIEGKVKCLDGVIGANGYAYKGMQMFYLEPTHMLDGVPTELRRIGRRSVESRYSVNLSSQWSHILLKDLRRQDMSLPQVERLEPIFKELDNIVSTIRGEIVRDETKLVFKDADIPSDKTVSLMNIASGAKSMAAIVRGMRNDSIHPGDFIIIDEPESNLHPEWQVQFAKFLVLLHAKFDIRFLLNTHSPDFLKAIEVYSDLLEQQSDCSYYNMVSETGRQYDTKCVNDNRDEIFRSMGKPFISLMHGEHYEQPIS